MNKTTMEITMPVSKNPIAQNYKTKFNISPDNDFELYESKCSPGGESDDDLHIFIETDPSGKLIAKYKVYNSYKYSSGSTEHYFHKYSPNGELIDTGQFDECRKK